MHDSASKRIPAVAVASPGVSGSAPVGSFRLPWVLEKGEEGSGTGRKRTVRVCGRRRSETKLGDRVTVFGTRLGQDERGQVAKAASQEGGALVFRDQMCTTKELSAAPGQYVLGFVVQELDRNAQQDYA